MTSFSELHKLKRAVVFTPSEAEDTPAPAANDLRRAAPAPVQPAHYPLLVQGQGTFIFKYGGDPTVADPQPLHVAFRTAQDPAADLIRLELDTAGSRLLVGDEVVAACRTGVVPDPYAYYWLSLDTSGTGWLRCGIGEARLETHLLAYQLPREVLLRCRAAAAVYYSPAVERMRLLRDPIVAAVPLEVRGTERLTMNDVATGRYLPAAALPPSCRQLYDTIAGPHFVLDSDDFPEFSQAVRYSIETPGCWCYEKLEAKRGPDRNRVYLRITLGHNGGESPGIPFVMEIWPAQCYSAVHQHAGANAIIRVLSGRIHVTLYPYLVPTSSTKLTQEAEAAATPERTWVDAQLAPAQTAPVLPFAEQDFEPGAITWITPLLNQVHQLRNLEPMGGPPCITIQCYQYDESDTGHYPFFDYDKQDGDLHQFEPDSDMDFVAFKARMQAEWRAKLSGQPVEQLPA